MKQKFDREFDEPKMKKSSSIKNIKSNQLSFSELDLDDDYLLTFSEFNFNEYQEDNLT